MNSEYAAGAIVFRRENNSISYLLIYSRRNKTWGFPKGHMEAGEDEIAAARREIAEETGIKSVVLLPGFRQENIYRAVSNRPPSTGNVIEKHSVYFLARADSPAIRIHDEEICGYRWLELPQALCLLEFDSLKQTLETAHRFLAENNR